MQVSLSICEIGSCFLKPGSPVVNITRDMLKETPVLDSVVEETLHLTSAPILIRAVLENLSLKMANGREYTIRKGDRVALFPHVAVQMDPEVHPEPHSFKYDRFLNQGGTKKDFYKNGKKLKYFNMPWGAGISICPGCFFAVNEIKLFVFLISCWFHLIYIKVESSILTFSKHLSLIFSD
uniref:Cytochrome P450 n=1 Tax=Pelusios castaneus TaxID=367368 RepID=A0A8C8VJR8_9SAUR